jgi:predicted nucleic acid-binding protein
MTSAVSDSVPKILVVDAMVLISAVIGEATPKLIQTLIPQVNLYAPEHAFEEAEKHLPTILRKRDTSDEDVRAVLETLEQLKKVIASVPKEDYSHLQNKASQRISRDPKDWSCVALALLLNAPIWTRDTDYFGTGLAIWTNETVELYLAV